METQNISIADRLSYEKIAVELCPTSEEGSRRIAGEIADLIRERQKQGLPAVLGLATGNSPKKVYRELVRLHQEEGLSFKNVISFNLDEYYGLPADHLQSYHHFMVENLFSKVDINPENWHVPDGLVPREELKAYCQHYEDAIAMAGGIDYQLLGIGRDGHIGFNEPGSTRSSQTRLMTLHLTTRLDASLDFGGLVNVPKKAITMGVGTILKAKRIVLMAWGETKSEIIRSVVEGPVSESVPASFLQEHSNVKFIVDDSCAEKLTRYCAPWLTEDVVWSRELIKQAVTQLALNCNKPILGLTDNDYNENGLSDLLALYGGAYDINIEVFNWLQHTITGWPGGKPSADDTYRPERAEPASKRVLIFSPHPDDDIISMGGTLQRLVDQGHDVHVAYQTSGNIAVADDEALRFLEFQASFNERFGINSKQTVDLLSKVAEFLNHKKAGEKDIEELREVKTLIREGEARNTCRFSGIAPDHVHFLRMPFYETGLVEKNKLGQQDYEKVISILRNIKPHQVFAAGDWADPHGTHKVCFEAIAEAFRQVKEDSWVKDCWLWLYKGAWAEWDISKIEMAVPMSPDQVLKKRHAIFKHQSQKDGAAFLGSDNREFWQRAEDRNEATANLYNKLGLAEYAAMEAFVKYKL